MTFFPLTQEPLQAPSNDCNSSENINASCQLLNHPKEVTLQLMSAVHEGKFPLPDGQQDIKNDACASFNLYCPFCPSLLLLSFLITTTTIIIIIALKGAIQDFLQSPHCAANRLQHVRSSGSGANRAQITCNTSSAYHMQHVVLRATWYEGTAQPLSLTEFTLRLRFILLAEPLTNEGSPVHLHSLPSALLFLC